MFQEKRLIIIAIDANVALKNSTFILIKKQTIGVQRHFINMIKNIYLNPTDNIKICRDVLVKVRDIGFLVSLQSF